ncbi:MAG: lactate utilization protein [Hyphomicrobiales bacterium]|nr:lactate utilization protein [Hyphomicrobiales bacterium]
MSARDDVLSNIRRSLGVTGQESTRRSIVAQRLEQAPRGPIPARGQGDEATRMATFVAEAQRVSASFVMLANRSDVPGEVARFLSEAGLPPEIRMGDDARLTGLDWTGLNVLHGRSHGADLTALSHAFAGVAETGSLVVLSGVDNPNTLNYLPDNHLIVLSAADLCADLESVWVRLRSALGKALMPRTVNIITGPSRSADIEQTLLLGAHGPRRLHILVTP